MKKVLASVLVIAALGSASYLLGWSSFFSVKALVVVGAPDQQETDAVMNVADIKKGEKLARIETRVVLNSLSRISWVDHSRVSRDWVHQKVTIQVWPRVPVARHGVNLVDISGVEFALPSNAGANLPVLNARGSEALKFAIVLLSQLPAPMTAQLQSITTSGTTSATLLLLNGKNSLQIIWGDESDTALKVQVYQALLALPENAKISLMDVSAPHAPIVK